jgi:hypothetical protein
MPTDRCGAKGELFVRLVLAIVSFVVAAVLIGAGIAQQTIFKLPDEVTASVDIDSDAPVTVIDGSTFTTFPHNQNLTVTGEDGERVFAAYGRTNDVLGWVGDTSYNLVSYDTETGQLASSLERGTESKVPNPVGSDLWLAEYNEESTLATTVNVDDEVSFVLVSDGTAPAPSTVSISWPLDNEMPWSGPLLIGGAVILILGLGFLLWAIAGMRSSRGPRRKTPKTPKLPKRPRYKPSKRARALPAGRRRRNSTHAGMVVAPLALAGVVALAGCTPTPVPAVPSSDAATATATSEPVPTVPAPAVTERQAGVIMQRVADVATKADEDLDSDLAATRFSGPALRQREANYKIRKADKEEPPVAAIPTGTSPQIILPQQNEQWPRTVFLVVPYEDETLPQLAVMLVQDDARSNYKVQYSLSLQPGAQIPEVAGAETGVSQLPPDITLFTVVPSQLAAAYGDILLKDEKSASFPLFDESDDLLRDAVGLSEKKKRQKALPDTAKLTFTNKPGDGQVIVLATNDTGALVAVELEETETVKPVETGATVSAPKDVRALSGKSTSTTGLRAVYGDQLLFYVPAKTAEAGAQAKLLGYASGMIGASEVKK